MTAGNNDRELEGISDFFISGGNEEVKTFERPEGPKFEQKIPQESEFGVDELTTIRRRITIPDAENAQTSMNELLQRYMEEHFTLFRVELRRTSGTVENKARKSVREEVIILLKEPSQ